MRNEYDVIEAKAYEAAARADSQHAGNKEATRKRAARAARKVAREAREVGALHAAQKAEEAAKYAEAIK